MNDSLVRFVLRLAPLALRRAPGLREGQDIPRIEAGATVAIDRAWLARYRAIIGAVDDGVLPPCVPQVLAVGLHLKLLGDRRFPLPVLGMVHMHNRIEETAVIAERAVLDLRAVLEGQTRTERGVTIDTITEARVDGALAWRSVMTVLVRDARRAARPRPSQDARDAPTGSGWSTTTIQLPADLGRRYSRIAGDANPIHLSAVTARPFGFPRAIIHGMWTLARALVEADGASPRSPRTISARFVKPVFLPGQMVVSVAAPDAAGAVAVRVTPVPDGAPHMLATIAPADCAP